MTGTRDSKAPGVPPCPICGKAGQSVPRVTVAHQVRPGVGVGGERYYLCRTPECDVAYYMENGTATIHQDQLNNKIWFKNVSSPKPICYCANVTDEEVIRHVVVLQCCSTMEDIQRHTGANQGFDCLSKNPTGG